MKKKWWVILAAVAVLSGAAALVMTVLMKQETVASEKYDHDSSLRWYDTVEDIVIDGKKDDVSWNSIRPFVRTSSAENRDADKYEALESRIQECNAEVYTFFGAEGLYIYAETDDPVINTTAVSPFNKSAFEFYLCSRDALNKMDHLFEFTVSADDVLKLRVRTVKVTTGKEGWENTPCVGVKSMTSIHEKGYSVECFIPWTTLNMDGRPEYLQMATAMIRYVNETDNTDRFWECFDYYSAPINLTNSSTYPLFDKNGYVEFAEGENFAPVHSNIIDFSTDSGSDPYVTTLNRSTVTAYLDKNPAEDIYWETTVSIKDFNNTDDPRVGILIKSEEEADGSFDRVYLMLQLDKSYEGEGVKLDYALMLPSNSKTGNNWKSSQRYILDSHAKNDSFRLAILKQNGVCYFYLDDVLLCTRNVSEIFSKDTKVYCGITSWYTGAVFSDYRMVTENLTSIRNSKADFFVGDDKYANIRMDILTEAKGYIKTDTRANNQSVINFNKTASGNFHVTTHLSELKAYQDAKDTRNGIVLTRELDTGYRRICITLVARNGKDFDRLQILTFANDNFGEKWDKVVTIATQDFSARAEADLAVIREGDTVIVLLDGEYMTEFSLRTYNMQQTDTVGLTAWKSAVKFSEFSLTTGSTYASGLVLKNVKNRFIDDYKFQLDEKGSIRIWYTATSNKEKSFVHPLNTASSSDVYFEAAVTPQVNSAGDDPRTGIALESEKDSEGNYGRIYLMLQFEKGSLEPVSVIALPATYSARDKKWTNHWYSAKELYTDNMAQVFYPDSIRGDGTYKLAIAKKGSVLSFFLNDVLLGTKENVDCFDSARKVTANLASWNSQTCFKDYMATADNVSDMVAAGKSLFVADGRKGIVKFDYQKEAAGIVTTSANANNQSVLKYNEADSDYSYIRTKLDLNSVSGKAADGRIGYVLTAQNEKGFVRFYTVLTGLTEEKITRVNCLVFENDDLSDWSNKTVLSSTVSLEKQGNYLTMVRRKDFVFVAVNDKLVQVLNLADYGITGKTELGLTSWKATGEYSQIDIRTSTAAPEVKLADPDGNPISSYNKMMNDYYTKEDFVIGEDGNITITLYPYKATKKAGDKSADIYYEAVIHVQELIKASALSPYNGILLRTDADGSFRQIGLFAEYDRETGTIDFIQSVPNKSGGDNRDTGAKIRTRYYPETIVNTAEDVKLAIAKKGNEIFFFINDVLYDVKSGPDGIDSDTAVVPYYQYQSTDSVFTGKVITGSQNVAAAMNDLESTFVADKNKNAIYFDLSKEDSGIVTTNETGAWASSSVVNWNGVMADRFLAETKVRLTDSHVTSDAYAGIVLTGGDNRFFVLLRGTGDGINYLECYSMTKEIFDNYNAEKYPQGKVRVYQEAVSLKGENQLAVYRNGSQLLVVLNGVVKKMVDLSATAYPITDTTTVGLTGWKAQAVFSEYRILTGDDSPTPGERVELIAKASSEARTEKQLVISDENEADIRVKVTGTSASHGYLYFGEKSTGIYAETYVDLISTEKGDHRVGLSLINAEKDAQFGFYLYAKDTAGVTKLQMYWQNAGDASASYVGPAVNLTGIGRKDIKLAVLRSGDLFAVYVNDSCAYSGKLSDLKNTKTGETFQMTATTETYIGLNVMQKSGEFYGYSYACGEQADAVAAAKGLVEVKVGAAGDVLPAQKMKKQYASTAVVGADGKIYVSSDMSMTATNNSSGKALAYINSVQADNRIFVAARISMDKIANTGGWNRIGFALTTASGTNVDFTIKSTGGTKAPDGFKVNYSSGPLGKETGIVTYNSGNGGIDLSGFSDASDIYLALYVDNSDAGRNGTAHILCGSRNADGTLNYTETGTFDLGTFDVLSPNKKSNNKNSGISGGTPLHVALLATQLGSGTFSQYYAITGDAAAAAYENVIGK